MGLDAPSLKLVGHGQFKRVNPNSDLFKVTKDFFSADLVVCLPSCCFITVLVSLWHVPSQLYVSMLALYCIVLSS